MIKVLITMLSIILLSTSSLMSVMAKEITQVETGIVYDLQYLNILGKLDNVQFQKEKDKVNFMFTFSNEVYNFTLNKCGEKEYRGEMVIGEKSFFVVFTIPPRGCQGLCVA